MIIEERLNKTTWVARRESTPNPYRIIVKSETELNINESYSKNSPENLIICCSLCELCAKVMDLEYLNDSVFSEDQKQDAMGVIDGSITKE